MPDNIPSFKPGDVIEAAKVDKLREAATRKITAGGGLFAKFGRHGTSLGIARKTGCNAAWIRIEGTHGTSAYDYQEIFPTSGGGWSDGRRSGDSRAIEVNGNISVASGTIVWGLFDSSGAYVYFQFGACP